MPGVYLSQPLTLNLAVLAIQQQPPPASGSGLFPYAGGSFHLTGLIIAILSSALCASDRKIQVSREPERRLNESGR